MMLRRKRIDYPYEFGMTEDEFHRLARFNDEVAHGIAHTPEYDTRMRSLEIRYLERIKQRAKDRGDIVPDHSDVMYGFRVYQGDPSGSNLLHDTATDGPMPDHLAWLLPEEWRKKL